METKVISAPAPKFEELLKKRLSEGWVLASNITSCYDASSDEINLSIILQKSVGG